MWGIVGGAIVVYMTLVWNYIRSRKAPREQRKRLPLDAVTIALWAAFPGITGLVSLSMEPPSRFFASFVGAATAAIVYVVAANLLSRSD